MAKRKKVNFFKTVLPARSVNEGYARVLSAAFAAQLDPTVEQIADIKTAVSEAVTNCIVHAYKNEKDEQKKKIVIEGSYFDDGRFTVSIRDFGCGIENVELARQPLYTTGKAEERSGMGFSIMESFTDSMKVTSAVGRGTKVTLTKKLYIDHE